MLVRLCKNTDWLFSQEAFAIYQFCMYQPTYEKYRSLMERLINNQSVKIYVCEAENHVIGMLVLNQEGKKPEIAGIAVSEMSRKQGVGRYMIQQVMETEHLPSLFAQTDEDAAGFYQCCGFEVKKVRVSYPDGIAVRFDCELVQIIHYFDVY